MKAILDRYMNIEVGMNIEKPFHFEPVTIIDAQPYFFSVQDHDKKNIHHFSYNSIVQIIENKEGIDIGGFFSHQHFSMVIKVGHLFEYVPT